MDLVVAFIGETGDWQHLQHQLVHRRHSTHGRIGEWNGAACASHREVGLKIKKCQISLTNNLSKLFKKFNLKILNNYYCITNGTAISYTFIKMMPI